MKEEDLLDLSSILYQFFVSELENDQITSSSEIICNKYDDTTEYEQCTALGSEREQIPRTENDGETESACTGPKFILMLIVEP